MNQWLAWLMEDFSVLTTLSLVTFLIVLALAGDAVHDKVENVKEEVKEIINPSTSGEMKVVYTPDKKDMVYVVSQETGRLMLI